MSRKRKHTPGTKACTCDKCGMRDPSTVEGTRHRRCGGSQGAPRREKHTRADVAGTWR